MSGEHNPHFGHIGRNQYTYGVKMSREIKNKIAQANAGKKWTEEMKRRHSEIKRKQTYQRVCKTSVFYKGVKMDSSYEVRLAKILDELQIEWIRPEPLTWIDNKNLTHNYFPDFYCKQYNIYFDPKNDYCFRQQKEKIDYIRIHYVNVIFLTEQQLTKEYVTGLMVKLDITTVF